MSYYY